LKKFVEIIIEEGNRMTNFMKDTKVSTVDDLMLFVSHYTLNTICGKYWCVRACETGCKYIVFTKDIIFSI